MDLLACLTVDCTPRRAGQPNFADSGAPTRTRCSCVFSVPITHTHTQTNQHHRSRDSDIAAASVTALINITSPHTRLWMCTQTAETHRQAVRNARQRVHIHLFQLSIMQVCRETPLHVWAAQPLACIRAPRRYNAIEYQPKPGNHNTRPRRVHTAVILSLEQSVCNQPVRTQPSNAGLLRTTMVRMHTHMLLYLSAPLLGMQHTQHTHTMAHPSHNTCQYMPVIHTQPNNPQITNNKPALVADTCPQHCPQPTTARGHLPTSTGGATATPVSVYPLPTMAHRHPDAK